MQYVIVKYTSMPTIKFCHTFETDKKESWGILPDDSIFELTAIEKGSFTLTNLDTGEVNVYKEGDVFVTLHRNNMEGETDGEYHKHSTIFFTPADVTALSDETDVLEYAATSPADDCLYGILPFSYSPVVAKLIALRISQIVENFHTDDLFKTIRSTALLIDILSISTTRSIETAKQELIGTKQYSYTVYCHQAMRYISKHITENLKVEDIAASMKVSYGHLSRIFKSQIGQTLVDYINRQKVKLMEEILATEECSVSDVSAKVGIGDEKYAARLFRKYTGLTITSYIKMNRMKQNVNKEMLQK